MSAAARREALVDKVRSELDPDEQLIWTGHPDADVTFRRMRFLLWIGVPLAVVAGILTFFHSAGVVALIIGAALTAASWHRSSTQAARAAPSMH